ncbi:MAG: hypothetical protein Tsb0015_01300 [Simkaniaceae bacterium]
MKRHFIIISLLSSLILSCSSKEPKKRPSAPVQVAAEEKQEDPKKDTAVQGTSEGETWQEQIQKYDSQIRKKTNQKNLHLAKAARAQDQGDRLQFQQGNLLDARRYWQIADYHREQAQLLEKEIQLLQLEKQQLLQKHGVPS